MLQTQEKSSTIKVQGGRAICPSCHTRTQIEIRQDTVLINYPLYCKRCKRTTLVRYGEPEPESLSQSTMH